MSQHKLLYITSVCPHREDQVLRAPTQALLSALSRDFDISLAVVGPVSQTTLNELRVKLGITRVTGGFERGLEERAVGGALKSVYESSGLEPYVNGRLKAAIQRRAADFESVVIDSLEATPYTPLGIPGKTIYFAQEIASDADGIGRGFLGGRRIKRVKELEFDALSRCDRVFSVPSTATQVLALGFRLVSCSTRQHSPVQQGRRSRLLSFQQRECGLAMLAIWVMNKMWPVSHGFSTTFGMPLETRSRALSST
ncbi:hypothetical protein PQY66_02530 [Luminiphilus sp.]|nr:hypothetical protein [Luminiphilus sp.]